MTRLLATLILATVAFGIPFGVAARHDQLVPLSKSGSAEKPDPSGDLAKYLEREAQAYDQFMKHTGQNPKVAFKALAEVYAVAKYSPEEFAQVFADTVSLLMSSRQEVWTLSTLESGDVQCEGGTQSGGVLIVYIDPTCGHCKDVVDLVADARGMSKEWPATVFRFLPSNENTSLKASSYLFLIRQKAPSYFCSAAHSFLTLLSVRSEEMENLWSDYRVFIPKGVTNEELQGATEELQRAALRFPSSEFGAPLVIYRGRVLGKKGALNPFKNSQVLSQIILLINLWDQAGKELP